MVTKLNMRRMTLTLPVLEAANRVAFLVAGEEKSDILHTVLQEKCEPPLPAQLVQPRDRGLRLFLVDKAAAAKLVPSVPDKVASAVKPAGTTRGRPGRTA